MNEPPGVNEPSRSIWKRPMGDGAWFALLIGISFLVICGPVVFIAREGADYFLAFMIAGSLVVLVSGLILFARFLRLRKFILGVACLITLVALLYAEEDWRGKWEWQRHRQKWEAKGEVFNTTALLPPTVPDDQNFALTPLLRPTLDFTRGTKGIIWNDTNGLAKLRSIDVELYGGNSTNEHLKLGSLEVGNFADIPACASFYRGNTNYPQAPLGSSPGEVMLAALDKFRPQIEELRQAAVQRPKCRFPIEYDYEPPWAILLPHLAPVKQLTLVCDTRVLAELELGQSTSAFEDLKLGFRLSDCLSNEPFLIDNLVRASLLGSNLQVVREGLARHAWPDAQLAELQHYLASVDVLAEYQHSIKAEQAFEIKGIDFLRRQGFRRNPMTYLTDSGTSANIFAIDPVNIFPSGWFYQNMLSMSQLFEDFVFPQVNVAAHRVFPEKGAQCAQALRTTRVGPFTLFEKLLMPAMESAARKPARMQTFVDAGQVACALERFRLAQGKLPAQLQELVPSYLSRIPTDVIDGHELRYRPQPGEGYRLYSIGWNQMDDGGENAKSPRARGEASVDISRGDWVWDMRGEKNAPYRK